MDPINLIITLVILLFSAIVHEISHGLVAEKLGDDTARDAGRITLNPIPHLDPFGSILLPILTLLASGGTFAFGAAKPVPVNFNNLRNARTGMALVSLAGPGANFALAIICAIPLRLGLYTEFSGKVLASAVIINLLLGIFNLIPIPPLDGSKVLASFGSYSFINRLMALEQYGFIIIIAFLYLGLFDRILIPAVDFLSRLLLGG